MFVGSDVVHSYEANCGLLLGSRGGNGNAERPAARCVCDCGVLGGAVDVSGILLTECRERCWKNDWVIDLAVHGTPNSPFCASPVEANSSSAGAQRNPFGKGSPASGAHQRS